MTIQGQWHFSAGDDVPTWLFNHRVGVEWIRWGVDVRVSLLDDGVYLVQPILAPQPGDIWFRGHTGGAPHSEFGATRVVIFDPANPVGRRESPVSVAARGVRLPAEWVPA